MESISDARSPSLSLNSLLPRNAMLRLPPRKRARRRKLRKRRISFLSSTLEAIPFCQMPISRTLLSFTLSLIRLLLTSRFPGKMLNLLYVKIFLVLRSSTLELILRKETLHSHHTD